MDVTAAPESALSARWPDFFGSPCRWVVSPLRRRATFRHLPCQGFFASGGPLLSLNKSGQKSACPDVYWESCSPCVAVASERRWTLRLPPSPRFQRAGLVGGRGSSPSAETQPDGAGLVDRRGLAGLASRRCLLGRRGACCRFPAHPRTLERTPRAERSDRKTTAPPSPQRKPPIQARGSGYRFKIPQVCTAQQNTNLNQGQRLPDPAAIIIGGRQAEFYPTPS